MRFEMALAGLPFITISTVPIQNELSDVFVERGAAINLGLAKSVTSEMIISTVQELLFDYKTRMDMREKSLSFIDKKGPERICNILTKHSLGKSAKCR